MIIDTHFLFFPLMKHFLDDVVQLYVRGFIFLAFLDELLWCFLIERVHPIRRQTIQKRGRAMVVGVVQHFFSSNSGGLLYIYCTTGNGRDVIPQCKYTYSLSVWCDVVVHMTLSWMRAGCDGKIPFENVSSLEKTLSSSLNKRIERRWLDFAQPASTQEQSGTRCDVWVYIRCSKDLHI